MTITMNDIKSRLWMTYNDIVKTFHGFDLNTKGMGMFYVICIFYMTMLFGNVTPSIFGRLYFIIMAYLTILNYRTLNKTVANNTTDTTNINHNIIRGWNIYVSLTTMSNMISVLNIFFGGLFFTFCFRILCIYLYTSQIDNYIKLIDECGNYIDNDPLLIHNNNLVMNANNALELFIVDIVHVNKVLTHKCITYVKNVLSLINDNEPLRMCLTYCKTLYNNIANYDFFDIMNHIPKTKKME